MIITLSVEIGDVTVASKVVVDGDLRTDFLTAMTGVTEAVERKWFGEPLFRRPLSQ